jgi:hypothetical protein
VASAPRRRSSSSRRRRGEPEPPPLGEPSPHRTDAGHGRVIKRMPFAQPRDRGQRTLPEREALLCFTTQPRPRVRTRLPPRRRTAERPDDRKMCVERPRAGARETTIGAPRTHQRHNEVPAGIRTQKRSRMVPRTEPDPDPMRELALERLAARAIKADRADRRLERNVTSLVQGGQTRHTARLPGPDARNCAGVTRFCAKRPNGTRRECQLASTAGASTKPRCLRLRGRGAAK